MKTTICYAALGLLVLGACSPQYQMREPYSYVDSVRLDDGSSRDHATLIEDYAACDSYSRTQALQAMQAPTEGTYRLETTPSPNRGRHPDFTPRVNDVRRNEVQDSVPAINDAMASRARVNLVAAVREQTYVQCMVNAGWVPCYDLKECETVERSVLRKRS